MPLFPKSISALASCLLLIVVLGCQKKLSEQALAAQEAAKAADARVASLEQQRAEIKAAKPQPSKGDKAAVERYRV